MKNALTIIAIVFLIGCSSNKKNTATFDIRFGIIGISIDGQSSVIEEATNIPRRDKSSGFRYGITVLPSDNQPFSVYVVAGFPSLPETFSGLANDAQINLATKSVTSPTIKAKGQTTIPFWFDSGDPLGKYSLQVFINGHSAKLITYNVELLKDL